MAFTTLDILSAYSMIYWQRYS